MSSTDFNIDTDRVLPANDTKKQSGSRTKVKLIADLGAGRDRVAVVSRQEKTGQGATILATLKASDGTTWELRQEILGRHDDGWQSYDALNNSDTHAFNHPAYQKALTGRIVPAELMHLSVWRKGKIGRKLMFYVPVYTDKAPLKLGKILRGGDDAFSPLATPSLADDNCEEALSNFALLCRQAFENGLPPIALNMVPGHSNFVRNIEQACKRAGAGIVLDHLGERPMMKDEALFHERHKSKKSTLKRSRRRLEAEGEVTFEMISELGQVKAAFEEFLQIEAAGWKGKNGTAVRQHDNAARFATEAVAELTKSGHCEMALFKLDGKTIASTVLLNRAGNYFPWKVTFDEAYSRFSPGALSMMEISEALLKRPGFNCIDSVSGVGPTWTGNLWPERMQIYRVILGKSGLSAKWLSWQHRLLEKAKKYAKKLLRRKSY